MGSAVMMYAQDYDEVFPWMWQGGASSAWVHVPVNQTASSNYYIWAEFIYPYVKNDAVFQCPSRKFTQAQMPYATFPISYNYNGNNTTGISGVSMAAVEAPASTVLLYDGWTMDSWWYAQDQAALISGQTTANPPSPSPRTWSTAELANARRHNGGANLAFADGHAKWYNRATPSMFTRAADPD